MFNLDSYKSDLQKICSFDSGKGNEAGINDMISFFKSKYDELNLKTEIINKDKDHYAPMLLVSNRNEASIINSSESIDVLFLAHMDTVFDSETLKTWKLEYKDGIGNGPGAIDCKGGCLLVYYLIKDMLETKTCNYNFVIAYNSDEETGSYYSKEYFEILADRSKYALVFEPGRDNDEYVGIRKGGIKFKVKVHGIAAHSGVDFAKGANAIVELSKWIVELSNFTDLEKGTTVNIAKMDGGLNNGQVPDYAEAIVRLLYLEPSEIDRFNKLVDKMTTAPFDSRCSIEVEHVGADTPPMYMTENSKVLFDALDNAGKQVGTKTDWVTTGGMSDGNFIACHNVATLDGCGPAGSNMHTTKEFIKLYSVEERFNTMKQLLINLFK